MLAVLERAEVPSGKIYDIRDIMRDAHYAARGMIGEHGLPGGGRVHLPGIVPRLSGTPGAVRFPYPAFVGEHTVEILRAAGLGDAEIGQLEADGVIGIHRPA